MRQELHSSPSNSSLESRECGKQEPGSDSEAHFRAPAAWLLMMEPEGRLVLLPHGGTQLSSSGTRSPWSLRGGSRRVEEGGISAYFNTDHLVQEKKSFSWMRGGEERETVGSGWAVERGSARERWKLTESTVGV